MNYLSLVSHSRMRSGLGRRFYGSGNQIFRILGGFAFLFVLFSLSGNLESQTFYGSISGVVKDPTGAVVPGVAVTVHENGTTTEYKTVSNKAGAYRISLSQAATPSALRKTALLSTLRTSSVSCSTRSASSMVR